ncbi:MAG: extracellular solute-binding protein [Lachnospiraceae bacterium]|nr:extracellular solute-binding protein [Lachnospiraceae bacterium]
MKKKLSKVLGVVLAGTMILGTMAGCGTEEVTNSESAATENSAESLGAEVGEITYPLDTDEKLTIAVNNFKAITAVSKDYSATPFAEAWAEQTGVELEFICVENDSAMNLMFADGNLPDIVIWTPYNYAGGPAAAVADGIIEPITREELEKYAPDYVKVLDEGHPDLNRTYKTDDGEYFGFGQIPASLELRNSSGMIARGDWLKEWGMEVPDTLEELEAYLEKCKEKDTVLYPLMSSHINSLSLAGYLTSPFGLVTVNEYQIDGKVHLGYAEPEYKDYLAWLISLVERGLMDTSFTTFDNAVYGGAAGLFYGAVGGGIGTYMSYAEDPASGLGDFETVGIPTITDKDGVAHCGNAFISKPAGGRVSWITPQCDNKELAMKFLNYGYTEAGKLLFNFGVEGESYTINEEGKPVYTEWITNNPDGLSMQYAMAQYNRAAVGGGPMVQTDEYARQYFWRPQQQDAVEQWNKNNGYLYTMPIYTVADENTAAYAKIKSDIETYVAESRVKFITGEMSLDDFDTVYIQTLKDMGIDEYLEIVQEACDRFYAR